MNIWLSVLLLAVGFVLLIKGGDWFVDGASGIARRFRLPEILIGATVVSIGTTLPEVMVSAGAAFQGSCSISGMFAFRIPGESKRRPRTFVFSSLLPIVNMRS